MAFLKTSNTLIAFITKYKLYHLLFWFLYHSFWWSLRIGSVSDAMENIFFSQYSIKFAFYVCMQAFGVYFNLYFLIPRFLQRGNYITYVCLLALTLLCTSACITGGYYVNAWVVGVPFQELFNVNAPAFYNLFKGNALPSTLASMTLAMSIKLTKNWVSSEKRRNIIEKEKLETELKFLRSQFNPHFLFNTINSIFVLIHKDQDKASSSLSKFSELLRYQLYQCNEPLIPLDQELQYLKNFIELEKLRQDLGYLQLDVAMDTYACLDYKIAPFLLMPFVENAFKHVSHNKDGQNWIDIALKATGDEVHLRVSNSRSYMIIEDHNEAKGLGLRHVKRRLELLYPQAHSLKIVQDHKEYAIELYLKLKAAQPTSLKTA